MTLYYASSKDAEYDQSLIRLTACFDIAVLNREGVELLTDITIDVVTRWGRAPCRPS